MDHDSLVIDTRITDQKKCETFFWNSKGIGGNLYQFMREYLGMESTDILKELKEFQLENNMTIIMTTMNLEETLESDYLYIIADSKIILEGAPQQVLEHDNVLNKLGLELPFMMDLSVKLRDYDVLKEIELDMDRMVEKLWK